MNPSVEQLRKWSSVEGEHGEWIRVPSSAWIDVLWLLAVMEEIECVPAVDDAFAAAAARRRGESSEQAHEATDDRPGFPCPGCNGARSALCGDCETAAVERGIAAERRAMHYVDGFELSFLRGDERVRSAGDGSGAAEVIASGEVIRLELGNWLVREDCQLRALTDEEYREL